MRWLLTCFLVALACVTGCAEGEADPEDTGTTDTQTQDTDLGDASDTSDATDDVDDETDTQEPIDMCAVCCPGETECFDSTTRLVCRPSGEAYRQESCSQGDSCVEGECVSGAPNGTACTTADDCAGGKCHCGSEESCSPTPSAAFCTAECTPGNCGPDEICVESALVDGSSYNHCVPTCTDTCPISGLTCAALPTRDSGTLEWVQGCHVDTVDAIGAKNCSSDDTCAGDTCLTGYFDFPICTHACDGACPDGTACSVLPNGDGTAYCTPLCGSGSVGTSEPCPLAPDGDPFVASCEYREVVGGGSKTVCVNP